MIQLILLHLPRIAYKKFELNHVIVAPAGNEQHYRDYEPQDHLDVFFTGHEINYWIDDYCYPRSYRPDHHLPVNDLARHLFYIFYNTPFRCGDEEGLVPGHDYGHGSQHIATENRVQGSEFFFVFGDPAEKFQPDDDGLEDEPSFQSGHSSINHGNYIHSDYFCLLPNELMMHVFAYLPSRDVCKLRLISRYVADLSSLRLLSQKFWSSRFDNVGWSALPLYTKVAFKSENFSGLKNRRRIWHVFQHIYDALHVRLENEVWIGHRDPRESIQFRPQKAVYAEASSMYFDVCLSCRLFEWQDFLWPQSLDAAFKKLRVSSIYSDGKTYISGLRFLSAEGLESAGSRAGFVSTRKESEIPIGPYSSIDKLEVAMAEKGLIGLRFYFKDLKGSYAISVGDMEPTYLGCGISRLMLDDNMQCTGFYLRLDPQTLMNDPIEDFLDFAYQNPDPVAIWNPNIPEFHPIWNFPKPVNSRPFNSAQSFNLCLNMDFGGPGGQLLQSLVRLDVFIAECPSVILGMSFIYCDGSERFYGRKRSRDSLDSRHVTPAVRQSFIIDGPHGEVMTNITVTITTNFGRTKEFRLIRFRSMQRSKHIAQVLQAEPGMHFTAFFARIESLGGFKDFCAQSQVVNTVSLELLPRLSDVSHHIPINYETLISTKDIWTCSQGFAFTAADLTNLRKVRVSVDAEAHIPCLWLEYYDSSEPVIVEQWVKELGTLDVVSGDRIWEIVMWYDCTNPDEPVKGPMRKLRLGIMRGNTKEFINPQVDGKTCLQYRENPYEKLSGILWGCNYQSDHVGMYKDGRLNPVTDIEITYGIKGKITTGLSFTYEDGRHEILGSRGQGRE
ncbi:hypothetical protein F4804DRAFT_344309 [Jackrogersella minutella]|nr:hypothetical protein F4804DRAFT_344309 [Jackrogersella minutella]